MGRRSKERVHVFLPVKVRGTDKGDQPFWQTAQTLDVSRFGARLDGIYCLPGPGVTVEVECRGKKATFLVVWIGGMVK